jgi:hypothetical protein
MLQQNETRRVGSAGLAKASSVAGSDCEYSIHPALINKLCHRYGVSQSVAALIANLAGFGPAAGGRQ